MHPPVSLGGAKNYRLKKTGPFYVVSEWLKSAVEQLVNFEANAVVSSGSDV